jgi:uncharacterized protein (TIGR02246 family)
MIRRAAVVLMGFAIVSTSALAGEPPVEDRAGVEAVTAEFVRAFDAGDAKAVAALFTEGARIEADGEPAVEGRDAVERRFAEIFSAEPGRTLVVKTESLRFLGADAAVEEGSAAITTPSDVEGAPGEVARSRYTATYVRKDGRWLQDSIHDRPAPEAERSPRERLAELEWLIGEWVDEDDDALVHTACEWADGGAFLIRKFRVESDHKDVMTGHQRIGWDPSLKQFRSWTFDSEGGFSQAVWSHDPGDDRWIAKSTGVLPDGRTATATNVVTRLGRDLLLWTSTDRTVGGGALPDSETITLARRPPRPTPDPSAAIKGTQP